MYHQSRTKKSTKLAVLGGISSKKIRIILNMNLFPISFAITTTNRIRIRLFGKMQNPPLTRTIASFYKVFVVKFENIIL